MTEAAVARAGTTTTATGTHTTAMTVAKTGGTATATHAMSTVTALGVAVRFLAHGIASDTIMGWRARSSMSPRTPAGAGACRAVASGDRVRRETAAEVTTWS